MTIDEILIEQAPGETRVALMAAGRLVELVVEREGAESVVGNVYVGRVERVLPGIGAAFVDIGLPRSGFLGLAEAGPAEGAGGRREGADPRITDFVREGEHVVVQAQRDPVADKGAKLTARPGLTGRRLVLLPGGAGVLLSKRITDADERHRLEEAVAGFAAPGEGWIVRTAAAGAGAADLAAEAESLRAGWRAVDEAAAGAKPPACVHREVDVVRRVLRDAAMPALRRVVVDGRHAFASLRTWVHDAMPDLEGRLSAHAGRKPLFEEEGVAEALEDALRPRVPLPSGGSLLIEPTSALVSIDVNTGGHVEGGGREEGALATNLEAAVEVARQVRLRNLSGLLIVDLVPVKRQASQSAVLARLRDATADDRVPVHVVGFTRLGVVEMTRQRRGLSLAEQLGTPCPACDGTGIVAAASAKGDGNGQG